MERVLHYHAYYGKNYGSRDPASYWNRQLVSIKQLKDEDVFQYNCRFREALSQLQLHGGGDIPVKMAITWFQEGLHPELQSELERDYPAALEEALDSARKAEAIQRQMARQQRWEDPVHPVCLTAREETQRATAITVC